MLGEDLHLPAVCSAKLQACSRHVRLHLQAISRTGCSIDASAVDPPISNTAAGIAAGPDKRTSLQLSS